MNSLLGFKLGEEDIIFELFQKLLPKLEEGSALEKIFKITQRIKYVMLFKCYSIISTSLIIP